MFPRLLGGRSPACAVISRARRAAEVRLATAATPFGFAATTWRSLRETSLELVEMIEAEETADEPAEEEGGVAQPPPPAAGDSSSSAGGGPPPPPASSDAQGGGSSEDGDDSPEAEEAIKRYVSQLKSPEN